MIITHIDRLRREKGLAENRDITVADMSRETGLAYNTVRRLSAIEESGQISYETLGKLCRYFRVKSLCDLIEYVPDAEPVEPVPERPPAKKRGPKIGVRYAKRVSTQAATTAADESVSGDAAEDGG